MHICLLPWHLESPWKQPWLWPQKGSLIKLRLSMSRWLLELPPRKMSTKIQWSLDMEKTCEVDSPYHDSDMFWIRLDGISFDKNQNVTFIKIGLQVSFLRNHPFYPSGTFNNFSTTSFTAASTSPPCLAKTRELRGQIPGQHVMDAEWLLSGNHLKISSLKLETNSKRSWK